MIRPLLTLIGAALLAVLSPLSKTDDGANSEDGTRLLIRQLTVSDRFIVFSYAGHLWRVGDDGGEAIQLTTGRAEDGYPAFSPDGLHVAFSRRTADDWDVYVVPTQGGAQRRLTYNPEADIVRGWSPDGERVLFMSHRDEELVFRLYTIEADGVFPTALPLPRGYEASFSPDGSQIAYVPFALPTDLIASNWRYYRGGMASRIWVARLRDSSIEKMPREDSNDRSPIWLGNTIYFVSDRSGTFNLHAYNPQTKQIWQLTSYEKYGIESAAAGGGVIAFVQNGRIQLYDPTTAETRAVEVTLSPDTEALEPRTVVGARWIQSADVSAHGSKVVFGYRGEVVTFEPAGGNVTNVTRTAGVADRYPVISPDGERVAYVSDESGAYQLHVRRTDGQGPVTKIPTELRPSFYRELTWSPDSKRLAFTDKRLALWVADIETGGARRVATSSYSDQDLYYPAWAPGGRILAYSRYHQNRVRTVYVYDVQTGRKLQVSDGRAHAEFPVFDRNGKYLYFTASNTAPAGEFGWSVLSGVLFRPLISRKLQVVVLLDDTPSPVLPIIGEANPDVDIGETEPTRINRRGIGSRIVPLPVASRDYAGLAAVKPGVLMALVTEWPEGPGLGKSPTHTLYLYDLSKPKELQKFVEGVDEFVVSSDGSTVLYRQGHNWFLVPTDEPPEPGQGQLDLDALRVEVDPPAEWQQIYHEAWRLMDEFFYDPSHHGQNLAELERYYAEYLPAVMRRRDLNLLLGKALGHISVSHLGIGGGDIPRPPGPRSRIGLLGADYEIDRDRYRITRIYRSGHYTSPNRLVRAPLDQPGVKVTEGEFLLAVDGEEIYATKNLYGYFEGKALRRVEIKVGPRRDGRDARTYAVVPVPGENGLRRADWAERNREKVEELSGGKLGYVYVPNYGSGLQGFFRDVLGYIDRPGLIIDQRFAGGGITSDFLVEMLKRKPIYYYAFREGDDLPVPTNPVQSAKVLLVNDVNGSAAETFAFMFKLGRVGRVMGQRTSGAGIGPYVFIPRLIDGGRISIPNRAAYNPIGKWGIENHGIEPDIEVEWLPSDWREGKDPQLQTAINTALVDLAERPPSEPKRPAYPVHP